MCSSKLWVFLDDVIININGGKCTCSKASMDIWAVRPTTCSTSSKCSCIWWVPTMFSKCHQTSMSISSYRQGFSVLFSFWSNSNSKWCSWGPNLPKWWHYSLHDHGLLDICANLFMWVHNKCILCAHGDLDGESWSSWDKHSEMLWISWNNPR